ncbi:MAG: hypothetical protein JWM87_673 [Candidatus Eremiobacteraeota bacterium]|nr:hypothetical protein [Candidatus Eremiobacteraeota bacterium]
MRYQLGGRIVEGNDLPGLFDDGRNEWRANIRREIAWRWTAESAARRREAFGDEPLRAFGHVGTNVEMPPAVPESRMLRPAIAGVA